MSVYLKDLVPVTPAMESAYADAIEDLGLDENWATREYADREDWPTKDGVRTFAGGWYTDHRDADVQRMIVALAEKMSCPRYSAMMGLHCPYMGRLALAAGRVAAAKALVA